MHFYPASNQNKLNRLKHIPVLVPFFCKILTRYTRNNIHVRTFTFSAYILDSVQLRNFTQALPSQDCATDVTMRIPDRRNNDGADLALGLEQQKVCLKD
jgi:hypothetical protein